MKLNNVEKLNNIKIINIFIIIGSIISIIYINYICYWKYFGLDNIIIVKPILIHYLPINYILILISFYNISSSYVKKLLRKGFSIIDFKKLLFGIIDTSCSIYCKDNKYCIRLYSNDMTLHKIFSDMIYLVYGKKPMTFITKNTYVTQLYSKNILMDIKNIKLDFDSKLKIEFVRTIMSGEGWIAYSFVNSSLGFKIYPKLGFGSTIPYEKLSFYKNIICETGINLNLKIDKRYEKRGYLVTNNINDFKKFKEIGGFIEGVHIKKGIFKGIEKNSLLNLTLKLAKNNMNFSSKEEALNLIKNSCIDNDLKTYLYRIMLG